MYIRSLNEQNMQETETEKREELHELLYLDPRNETERQMLDEDEIIIAALLNPLDELYNFPTEYCIPLNQAIMLGAPIHVIDALCPPRIQDTIQYEHIVGLEIERALELALEYGSSFDIFKLILEKQPESQSAFYLYNLFKQAFVYNAPPEAVSLLLKARPDAVQQADYDGDTPLHLACYSGAPLEVIILLLDAWPEAILQENLLGQTPYSFALQDKQTSEDISNLLCYTAQMLGAEQHNPSPKEIMTFFVKVMWWKGVRLLLERYPAVTKTIDLPTNIMADFLSMVGQHCKLNTLWAVIRNEQDLLAGV